MASLQAPPIGWPGVQGIPSPPIVKRVVRLDVPVDKYPSVNKKFNCQTPLFVKFSFK